MVQIKKYLILTLIISAVFFLAIPLQAATVITTSYDQAKRTIHDEDDEVINTPDYKEHKYTLKLEQKLSKISYFVTSSLTNKNYLDLDAQDSKTKYLSTRLRYQHDKLNSFTFKTQYKTKRFRNLEKEEYNNSKFLIAYKRDVKKDYRLKAGFYFNRYEYLKGTSKDIVKTAAKVEAVKYFNHANLKLGSNYKLEIANRNIEGKDRQKQEFIYCTPLRNL
ncbi:MAG: hypothetical protein GY817_02195 [bacterium]|nr:hypothetical protein [bacterium]